MKSAKIILGSLFVLLLINACAHRGEDPVSTYYGAAEYHCYYHNNQTGKVFEGVDAEQKIADLFGKSMCETTGFSACVFDDCVQK